MIRPQDNQVRYLVGRDLVKNIGTNLEETIARWLRIIICHSGFQSNPGPGSGNLACA